MMTAFSQEVAYWPLVNPVQDNGLTHKFITTIQDVRVFATRLVKGALSDHLKTVVVPLQGWEKETTLALPCHDSLSYTVKVY